MAIDFKPRNLVQEGVELIDEMSDQELNQLVDYIRATYKTRRAQRNAKAKAELTPNARVRIIGPTRPQYLGNLTGTVEELRQVKVLIKLDCGPVGKFRNGKVLVPASMLEVI